MNYVCKTDEDCDDNNKCTIDRCVNKDCKYEVKEDCEEEKKEVKEENGEEVVGKEGFFRRLFGWLFNLF